MLPALRRGRFGVLPVCLSVPWRSCLGYRHAGCLQLSHRLPPEMRGLRTRPRTDVDPPRFLDRTAIGGGISSRRRRGRYLVPPRTFLSVRLCCEDIDECARQPGPCSHRCHNLPGRYLCTCPPGHALLADRKSCAGQLARSNLTCLSLCLSVACLRRVA